MNKQKKMLIVEDYQLYQHYLERLVNIALSQIEWHGLPETCDALYFERVLLYNGTAAMLKVEGTDMWATLGYVMQHGLTWYGYPASILGVKAAGNSITHDFNTDIKKLKHGATLKPDGDSWEILYDNRTMEPLMPSLQRYAKLLSECHTALRINLQKQTIPVIVLTDSNERLTMANIINQLYAHEPALLVNKTLDMDSFKTLELPHADFNGNAIMELLKSLWAEAVAILGIAPQSTKRERMLDQELTLNNQEALTIRSSRLLNRVEFCNRMNKKYGLNLSVNLTADSTTLNDKEVPYGEIYDISNGNHARQSDRSDEPSEHNK